MTRKNQQKRKTIEDVSSSVSSNNTIKNKKDKTPGNKIFTRNSFEDTKAERTDFPRGGNASEYSIKNENERNHQNDILYDVSIIKIERYSYLLDFSLFLINKFMGTF